MPPYGEFSPSIKIWQEERKNDTERCIKIMQILARTVTLLLFITENSSHAWKYTFWAKMIVSRYVKRFEKIWQESEGFAVGCFLTFPGQDNLSTLTLFIVYDKNLWRYQCKIKVEHRNVYLCNVSVVQKQSRSVFNLWHTLAPHFTLKLQKKDQLCSLDLLWHHIIIKLCCLWVRFFNYENFHPM